MNIIYLFIVVVLALFVSSLIPLNRDINDLTNTLKKYNRKNGKI